MKKKIYSSLFLFSVCISFSNAQTPLITWVSGSNATEQLGTYGTMGVAAASNIPGGRENGISWTDNSNNLWLFGGDGYASSATQGKLNDLWKYSISSNQWTWVAGSSSTNSNGTYGTLGVPATTNIPGARQNSISWKDSGGNLWLFGGTGLAKTGGSGYLNDLWKYNPTTNEWTWISGANTTNQPGNYGSIGVASSSNIPGARFGCVSWIYNDVLYLYGGQIAASTRMNDLWKFDIATNQWTWIEGSNTSNQNGIYGTLGLASSSNAPGARQAGISWTDNSNNFWMTGGYGHAATGTASYLNDLWKYNRLSNQWTWMSGADSTFQPANYGIQGVSASTNIPGARQMSIAAKDNNGDFWMFGAWGTIGPPFGRINDLWKYELTSNQWTWVAGSNSIDQTGTYGTLGVASSSNIPGARRMSVSWTDASGNFWLFGGNKTDGAGGSLLFNDLWKMKISSSTGIDGRNIEEAVSLFPNPCSTIIQVTAQGMKETKIAINNVIGEVIYRAVITGSKTIDVSAFPSGLYFLQTEAGTKKFIINH